MSDFFRFPQTPHLAWLGQSQLRDGKLLNEDEVTQLLANKVIVEEKLDGANLGISLDKLGYLKLQNRGEYLIEPYVTQFVHLNAWLSKYEVCLKKILTPDLIFFGEWCAAKHSLDYSALPDWFLLFDVYDRSRARFWSVQRRNQLAQQVGLHCVPQVTSGKHNISSLKKLIEINQSNFRSGAMEGIIIRRDSKNWCEQRAKLVRADFVQVIGEHWRRRILEWNQIDWKKNQRIFNDR